MCKLQEKILKELEGIALARVPEYLQVSRGELVINDTADLPQESWSAIAAIEKSAGSVKIKFYDKLKALELLGKHLGMFDGDAAVEQPGSPLLEAFLNQTKEAIPLNDLSEFQQAPAVGDELVESSGAEGV